MMIDVDDDDDDDDGDGADAEYICLSRRLRFGDDGPKPWDADWLIAKGRDSTPPPGRSTLIALLPSPRDYYEARRL